jgi:hypothetical protein
MQKIIPPNINNNLAQAMKLPPTAGNPNYVTVSNEKKLTPKEIYDSTKDAYISRAYKTYTIRPEIFKRGDVI